MALALDIKNLSVSYSKNIALKNVNLSVADGDFLGIIGPNGGGKSTLVKSVLGLIPIDSGEIEIYGKPNKIQKSLIGYVPQISAMEKGFPISVFDAVMTAKLMNKNLFFRHYDKHDEDDVYEKLRLVNIENLAKRRINELSGGEIQRMLIARALATNPKMLILDEPTANVDAISSHSIFELLQQLNETTTIIMVIHDIKAACLTVKTIACLNKTLVYYGKPQLSENIVSKLYDYPIEILSRSGAVEDRNE